MSGYSELRKGRFSEPGQAYLVTFTTAERRPLFEQSDLANYACQTLTATRLWYRSRLLCWVLMPDHWHGVIELGSMDDLSTTIQRVKSNSARMIRLQYPEAGHVWEKGFHDRSLRSGPAVLAAARHIVANPLRSGLARSVGQYPWWDAVWL